MTEFQNISVFIPLDQIKLAATFLNGDKALVVGTWDSSHAMMVVLAGAGGPRQCRRTPYRMQAVRKWSISAVALPESNSFCSETVC